MTSVDQVGFSNQFFKLTITTLQGSQQFNGPGIGTITGQVVTQGCDDFIAHFFNRFQSHRQVFFELEHDQAVLIQVDRVTYRTLQQHHIRESCFDDLGTGCNALPASAWEWTSDIDLQFHHQRCAFEGCGIFVNKIYQAVRLLKECAGRIFLFILADQSHPGLFKTHTGGFAYFSQQYDVPAKPGLNGF